MTSHIIPTTGPDRRRARRALGVLAGAAICVTPLALAPAASADNNPLGGADQLVVQIITSLPNTVAHPLGGSGGNGPPGAYACDDPELVGPLLSCVIDGIDDLLGGGQKATATKATMKVKAKSARKATRIHKSR